MRIASSTLTGSIFTERVGISQVSARGRGHRRGTGGAEHSASALRLTSDTQSAQPSHATRHTRHRGTPHESRLIPRVEGIPSSSTSLSPSPPADPGRTRMHHGVDPFRVKLTMRGGKWHVVTAYARKSRREEGRGGGRSGRCLRHSKTKPDCPCVHPDRGAV